MKIFFATGYLCDNKLMHGDKRKVETFDRMVRESLDSGLLVVDTRLNPYSRAACWRGSVMEKRLGDRYVSVKDWGNVNYKNGGEIKIADFFGGLEIVEGRVEETGWVPLLLCGCDHAPDCHRTVLGQKLKGEGWRGGELDQWGHIIIKNLIVHFQSFAHRAERTAPDAR